MNYFVVFCAAAALVFMMFMVANTDSRNEKLLELENCHYVAFPAATSHIKFKPCTGEGWVIVRGDLGYEWQKIL